MNKIIKIILIIAIALSQLILLPLFSFKSFYPNIILISCVILIFLDLEADAFLLASLGGLILDLAGQLRFGLNIVIMLAIVFLMRFVFHKFFPEGNIFYIILAAFISQFLFGAITLGLLGHLPIIGLLFEAVYAAIAAVIIYYLLEHFIVQKSVIKLKI